MRMVAARRGSGIHGNCLAAGTPLRIDVSELFSADAVGMDALLRVRERGATFEGMPIHLQMKMDSLARQGR